MFYKCLTLCRDRKNWLFCNTSKGAKSSAIIYRIVETAKANGLVVEKYLTYLMDVIENLEVQDEDMFAALAAFIRLNKPVEYKR